MANLKPHIVSELKTYGYSNADIQKLDGSMPDYELMNADVFLLKALLESLTDMKPTSISIYTSAPEIKSSSNRKNTYGNSHNPQQNSAYGNLIILTKAAVELVCFLPSSPGDYYSTPQIVTIPLHSTFNDIVETVRETLTLNYIPTDKMRLFCQVKSPEYLGKRHQDQEQLDPGSVGEGTGTGNNKFIDRSWYIELSGHKDKFSREDKYSKGIDTLESGDIVLVKTNTDNVGVPSKLHLLSANYGYRQAMVNKINTLEEIYEGWRSIRGDGNCYYRTVIYGLIEQIIRSNKREKLLILREKFLAVRIQPTDSEKSTDLILPPMQSLDSICDMLQLAADGLAWVNIEEFDNSILNTQTGHDLALVSACRSIVSRYLIQNQKLEISGISIADAILPSFPDISNMEEYCARYVDCMGEDAEGPLVYLGVLLKSLDCWGVTIFLDRRDDVAMNVYETPFTESTTSLGTVHLLLRPGHYDLLYPRFLDNLEFDCKPTISGDELVSRLAVPTVNTSSLSGLTSPDKIDSNKCNHSTSPPNFLTPPLLAASCSRMSFSHRLGDFNSEDIDQYFPIDDIISHKRVILDNLLIPFTNNCTDTGTAAGTGVIVYGNGQLLSRYHRRIYILASSNMDDLKTQAKICLDLPSDHSITYFARGDVLTLLREGKPPISWEDMSSCDENDVVFPISSNILTINVKVTSSIDSSASSEITSSAASFIVSIDINKFNDLSDLTKCILQSLKCDPDQYSLVGGLELSDFKSLHSGSEIEFIDEIKLFVTNMRGEEKEIKIKKSETDLALEAKIKKAFGLAEITLIYISEKITTDSLMKVKVLYCDTFKCQSDPKSVKPISESCNHFFCRNCLSDHLNVAAEEREVLGADLFEECEEAGEEEEEEDSNSNSVFASSSYCSLSSSLFSSSYHAKKSRRIRSIFASPDVPVEEVKKGEEFFPPTLCRFSCCYFGCGEEISGRAIENSVSYHSELTAAYEEINDYVKAVRSLRKCGLSDIICFEEAQPLHKLIQLGCNHFFHKTCLAHYIKSEIVKAKTVLRDITCYECEISQTHCSCMDCANFDKKTTTAHIYTESEIRSLVDDPESNFTETEKANYLMIAVRHMLTGVDDGRFKFCECFHCNVGMFIRTNETVFDCQSIDCGRKSCLKCVRPYHEGKTCEQAAIDAVGDVARANGIMIRDCPFCKMLWALPIDCLHATCQTSIGGCGGEFCYGCAAPRTPIMAHSNNCYHRPTCSFYDVCCENDCTGKGGKAHCVEATLMSGPCKPCRAAKTTNTCNHVPGWKACFDCRNKKRNCNHWCLNCDLLGKICSPPANVNNEFVVFSHDEMKTEEERIKNQK